MLFGPWTALVVVGVDVGMLTMRHMGYLGESMYLVRTLPIGFVIIGPLLAGVAATDAARISQAGNIGLVMAVRRRRMRYLWAWWWTILPASGFHTAAFAVMVLVGGDLDPRGGWLRLLLAFLVQLAVFSWFTALGSVFGRFLPTAIAALAAAATAFVAVYYLTGATAEQPRFSVFGDLGATVTQVGVLFNPAQLLLQLALLSGSAAALLWAPVRLVRERPSLRPAGTLACVAVVVALCLAQRVLPAALLVSDPSPPDTCVGDQPVVCYYHEHARYATPYIDLIARASRAALDNGYGAFVPRRMDEVSRRYTPGDPDVTALDPFEVNYPGDDYLVETFVFPMQCPQVHSDQPPSDEFWRNQRLLTATWMSLMGREYGPLDAAEASLVPLEPEEVAATMSALRSCDFE
ncbi:MAG: hypothetical protein LBD77_09545 [Bifidobacteriaceae bacterium]|jgi:hypothetical protein|nr:hypothetical protein [Bifidobacteriaceae bacterium]